MDFERTKRKERCGDIDEGGGMVVVVMVCGGDHGLEYMVWLSVDVGL